MLWSMERSLTLLFASSMKILTAGTKVTFFHPYTQEETTGTIKEVLSTQYTLISDAGEHIFLFHKDHITVVMVP